MGEKWRKMTRTCFRFMQKEVEVERIKNVDFVTAGANTGASSKRDRKTLPRAAAERDRTELDRRIA